MAINNFTINNRTERLDDIQRSFMWQLIIPTVITVAPSAIRDFEDLLVRCRSISLPQRSNEPITSNFMGTRQFYPGKADPGGGTLGVNFEDFEDLRLKSILYEWQQNIFNINPASNLTAGKSKKLKKRNLTKDLYLVMYGYNGRILPKMIKVHNAWIQNVADTQMSYDSNDSVKHDVTFQYDYWTWFPDSTAV